MAIGQYSATDKMGIVKGERVEIFQRSVLKNTTRTLMISKRFTSATLLRLQEAVLVFAPFQKGARFCLFCSLKRTIGDSRNSPRQSTPLRM